MKGSAAAIILSLVGLIVIVGMVVFIFFIKPHSSNSTSTADSSSPTPSIPVKDFAPGMPMAQKTTILIMSNDSSEEKYIVPSDQVDTYVKQLPPGYHVLSRSQK